MSSSTTISGVEKFMVEDLMFVKSGFVAWGWKVWEWIVLQPFGRTDGRHYISASIFFRHCRSFCKPYVHSQYLVRSCIDCPPLCHLRCHLRLSSWNCVCFYWTRLKVSFTNYDYKTKHDLRCAITSCIMMCGSKLRCAHSNPFCETCDMRVCGAFLGLRSVIPTSHFV